MHLYDGTSDVDFFYLGTLTHAEISENPSLADLVSVPCVLYDDGGGRVYRFDRLDVLADRYGVDMTDDAEQTFAAVLSAMDEIAPDRAEQALEMAESAQQAADEAKAIAEQAGTDPQLQTIVRLAMPSIDFASVTATDVASIPDYVPEWSTLIGQKLKKNSPCEYNGTIYRASQDVTVQDIYPPDVAGESQYYPIEVAPDGIIVYRTCHGEYDMVRAGEKRHYPDAEGPVYLAKVDTAYDPDTVPGNWGLVQE